MVQPTATVSARIPARLIASTRPIPQHGGEATASLTVCRARPITVRCVGLRGGPGTRTCVSEDRTAESGTGHWRLNRALRQHIKPPLGSMLTQKQTTHGRWCRRTERANPYRPQATVHHLIEAP